jgi:hypothetical protein
MNSLDICIAVSFSDIVIYEELGHFALLFHSQTLLVMKSLDILPFCFILRHCVEFFFITRRVIILVFDLYDHCEMIINVM